MSDHKSVKVTVLKDHTFAGKEYAAGDSYAVKGDEFQSTDQYLDTLRATGFAVPSEEAPDAPADESPAADQKPISAPDDAPAAKPKTAAKTAPKSTKNAGKNLKKK